MSILAFNRKETKYILNDEQVTKLKERIKEYMELDPHCAGYKTYKIQNIYYDTINNDLISKSIEKPAFKEKLRLRKYYGSKVYFLEIKKKCHGIVGKRRIVLKKEELDSFLNGNDLGYINDYSSKMAIKEIKYLLTRYDLKPKVYLSYERLGYFSKIDKSLRITIDSNLKSRRNNLDINSDENCNYIIPKDNYILEIKSINNYPLWLVKILTELNIKHQSFSKYGYEYKNSIGGKYDK